MVFSALLRLAFIFYYVNLNDEVFYYEYGNIGKNILAGKGYSLFHFENEKMEYEFSKDAKPFPSAYMPPGYVILTLPFFLIKDIVARNLLILIFQTFLAAFCTLLVFKLTKKIFNERTGLVASLIYALMPEFIYSTTSFGTTIVYHLFILLIFWQFYEFREKGNLKNAVYLIILSSILIYFRMEFVLFVLFFIGYFLYKKKYKLMFSAVFAVILTLLPWQIRNYYVFDEFVPMTSASGLNLYRGHNPYRPGVWSDEALAQKIKILPRTEKFEIFYNKLYQEEALKNIRTKGLIGETYDFLRKATHLWIYNPYDARSKEPFYLWFWIALLSLSAVGIVKTFNFRKFSIIYFFLVYHTLLAAFYFIIPRYQTMMKPALLPFAAVGLLFLADKIGKRKIKEK